jgi:hypothetical protein
MKKLLVAITLSITLIIANDKSAKLTYIANTGFLIEIQNKKVLIDALFGEKELSYCDTPDLNVIKSIINGENIDIATLDRIFLWTTKGQKVVKELINPSRIDFFKQTANQLSEEYKSGLKHINRD